MKKAGKVALVTIGVPVFVSGLMILDAHLRAGSVITDHENRLAAEITAFRLRRHPSPLLLPEDLMERPHFAFEEGHSGQKRVWEAIAPVIQFSMEPVDELPLSIARCQEILQENGLVHGQRRFGFEVFFLEHLRADLGKGLDGAPRLRRVAELLDQLQARRISAADLRAGEHILDRAEVLNAFKNGDPSLGKPGWRELYSRRILAAKRLNQLVEEMQRSPEVPVEILQDERRNRAHWRLTRAAVAVMIHHRENGRLPEEMHGLKMSGVVLQDADTAMEWTFPTD
jgi:hypothetical protein